MFLRLILLVAAATAALALSYIGVYAQTVFIDRSDVLIIADALTDGSPFPNQIVNPPFEPTITVAGDAGRDHEITINIPDMDPTESGPRAGIREGIAAGANVRVIFPQRAGIKNPRQAGPVLVDVRTSPGGPAAGVGLSIRPNTPGAAAEYEITFVAPANIPANSGTITIILDEDVQLPGVRD